MSKNDSNTLLFYKELNSTCNPEKLLEIANKGIFLYEPLYTYNNIKYHEYVVDISFTANQNFMIFNDKQYKRLVYFLTNNDKNNSIKNIVINKYFLSKLMSETDYNVINNYISNLEKSLLNESMDYIIKYLFKYNYVSIQFYNLFTENRNNLIYDLMEYFYFDNKNYYFNDNFNYNNYVEIVEYVMSNIYDVNIIKYCIEMSKKHNILISQDNVYNYFKIPMCLPFNIKSYTKKIYKSNKLKFIIQDNIKDKEYYEEVINTIFSDWFFDSMKTNNLFNLNEDFYSNIMSKYDINPKIINKYEIHNINDDKIYFTPFINKEAYKKTITTESISKDIYPLREKVFYNSDVINLILENPNYLLNLNINLIDVEIEFNKYDFYTNAVVEKIIIIIIYMVSLLHNKGNYFIMNTLLLYIKRYHNMAIKNNKIVFISNNFSTGNLLLNYIRKISNKTFRSYIVYE